MDLNQHSPSKANATEPVPDLPTCSSYLVTRETITYAIDASANSV